MTWEEHWAVLLSGSVAAVISLSGVFCAFWMTTRHDRRMDDTRRLEERQAATRAARANDVARIHMGVAMQAKDMTFAPFYGNAQALELLAACIAFGTNHGAAHPSVASWVMRQHGKIHSARQAYWWVAWIPVIRRGRANAWGGELALLGVALMEWQVDRRGDDWFASEVGATELSAPGR